MLVSAVSLIVVALLGITNEDHTRWDILFAGIIFLSPYFIWRLGKELLAMRQVPKGLTANDGE